jgi:hypothetical protein
MPVITEKQYAECSCCGSKRLVADEQYGCDACQRHIPYNSEERFEITVFGEPEIKHYNFDKLACAYAWLVMFEPAKDFRFLTLPYLSSAKDVRWLAEHLKVDTRLKLPEAKSKKRGRK